MIITLSTQCWRKRRRNRIWPSPSPRPWSCRSSSSYILRGTCPWWTRRPPCPLYSHEWLRSSSQSSPCCSRSATQSDLNTLLRSVMCVHQINTLVRKVWWWNIDIHYIYIHWYIWLMWLSKHTLWFNLIYALAFSCV